MRKLILLLLLIPNLVMAEKWAPYQRNDTYEFFYDEESIKDNKDGTYSLVTKQIRHASEQEIRRLDGRYVGVGSVMSKVIISCSPFKALFIETNVYKHKDLTGFIISKGPDGENITNNMIDTEIQKKTCGNNNAALTPAPTTIPTPSTKVSIEDAKSQCSDIGFKAGTEKFGDCVLELMQ